MGTIRGTATPLAGNWRTRGECRDDPDQLFVRGAAQHEAKAVCVPCPVRAQCLAEALDRRIEFGVWGGMTERERRRLLRRRPDVDSWTELLEQAARDHAVYVGQESERGFRAGEVVTDLPQPRQVVNVARHRRQPDHRHRRVGLAEPAEQPPLSVRPGDAVGVQS